MSTTPVTLSGLAPKAVNWSIALSVVLIVLGLFAIVIPSVSGIAITLFFGWAMTLSGVTHLIFAFKTHTTGSVIWEILVGAVYLVTGFVLLTHPLDGLFVLTLVLRLLPTSFSTSSYLLFVLIRGLDGVQDEMICRSSSWHDKGIP